MHIHAFRLLPGQDLRRETMHYVAEHDLQAAFILTCVGSLSTAALRLATHRDITLYEGEFEIIALVGTLGPDGVHLHLSISDDEGAMTGGHLKDGSLIRTTAEVVIGEAPHLVFRRAHDDATGLPLWEM